MRGYVIWGTSVGILLLTAACGKKESNGPAGAAPPAVESEWVANLKPGLELGTNLWEKQRVDISQNCFQLVKSKTDGAARSVQIARDSCPKDSLSTTAFASYELHEYIDADNISKPTNLFILYQQLQPVGLVQSTPEGYLLKDLCTLDDMFRSSCSLRLADGKIAGVNVNPAAPQARVARELKLQKDAQALRAALADSKSNLAKAVGALADSQKSVSEQKRALAALLLGQENQMKQLVNVLGLSLEGKDSILGLKTKLAEATKSVQTLQTQIETRAEELKKFDEPIKASRVKIEEGKMKLKDLNAKRPKVEGAELEKLLVEIGMAAALVIDEEERLRLAIADREASDLFQADSADRKALEKAKRASGLLQQMIDLTLEVIAKARVALNDNGNTLKLLKDGSVVDAIAAIPKLCQSIERIGLQLERLQALSLALKMN